MRSLHLILGNKPKVSTLQTIWELWFILSIVFFILTTMLWLAGASYINTGTIIVLVFHVVMSTLVGITTSENEPEEELYGEGFTKQECIDMQKAEYLSTPEREALYHYNMVNNK